VPAYESAAKETVMLPALVVRGIRRVMGIPRNDRRSEGPGMFVTMVLISC
jgi:hypothetical protein